MTDTKSTLNNNPELSETRLTSSYVQWGGLAAMLGPLLVLVANMYGAWRTYGPGPASEVEAAMTTPFLVFGGFRLLGGILVIFGLIALYAYQIEATGRLGFVGFIIAMIGSILLTASAWFQLFVVPAMAAEVPAFTEAARAAEVGQLLTIGLIIPLLTQAIGWVIFGIATYSARVFPRWLAVTLTIGALLLFVPVHGIPIVFQLAVASMGFLLFSGRLEPLPAEEIGSHSQ